MVSVEWTRFAARSTSFRKAVLGVSQFNNTSASAIPWPAPMHKMSFLILPRCIECNGAAQKYARHWLLRPGEVDRVPIKPGIEPLPQLGWIKTV